MARLAGTFSRLGPTKVMVIGDLMMDTYTIGKVRRISPEAPVAVLQVHHEEHRPGGSGNVMLNLVSLGSEVIAVGRIGSDAHGKVLRQSLEVEGVNTQGIVVQEGFKTPVKNRIIAENQQIVRVDYEEITPLSELLEQQIIETLPALLAEIKVIAISDYGKGFLSKTLLAAIIDLAIERSIPVIADPKGLDFAKYNGVTIIKPNLSEVIAASGMSHDSPFESICQKVLSLVQAQVLMVTRSEAGISLFHQDGARQDFPVQIREVKDVTGAGDTVLAMLACAIANGLSVSEAAQLSNIAAGIAIERFGCARISLAELAQRLLEFDVENKVFDEDHLFAMQEVLKNKSCVLLGVTGARGLTTKLYEAIRQLAQKKTWTVLVYIRDLVAEEAFVTLLASLREVGFIIVNSENMRNLCDLIEPEEVYVMENDQLLRLEHTEALLESKKI